MSSLDNYITGHYGEDQFDQKWEDFHAAVDDDATEHALSADEAMMVWKIGLRSFIRERDVLDAIGG